MIEERNAVHAARSLTVLIDGYFIDRPYGFGRYVRELVYAIDRAESINLVVAVPARGEPVARQLVRRARIVTAPDRFFPLWEQWVVPQLARRQGCDVIHFPYQSMSLFWPRRNSVVTLHDLMFLRPNVTAGSAIDRLAHVYRRWIFMTKTRFAGRIVSVSATTQNELFERTRIESTVIPNVCEAFATMHPAVSAGRTNVPYFLHRGASAPHKNTARVVAAFNSVRARFPDAELRLFGMCAADAQAHHIAGPGVCFLGKITDAELAQLYRNARAVVVPSLEEGFGLAIIEAFAFDAPVITSNRPPMSDIVGDAAMLVDPLHDGQIRDAMISILESDALAQRLRRAARERQRLFSADQVAKNFRAIYYSLAQVE